MPKTSKKLVLVQATFMPMTQASKENSIILKKLPGIHYPLYFCKDKENKMRALIDFSNQVNAMTPVHTLKLGLKIGCIRFGAEIIDDFTFETFKIVLASFQIENTLGRACFF